MQAVEIPLEVKGAALTGQGTRWQIAGADPMAFNDPDQPPHATIEEAAVRGVSGRRLPVGPCSVTLFALKTELASVFIIGNGVEAGRPRRRKKRR
jgi:hypothetical protein